MIFEEFNKKDKGDIIFQTSKGSVYKYNRLENASVRIKKSPGLGAGELHDKMICFFISPRAADLLIDKYHYMMPRYSYRIGVVTHDGFKRAHGNSLVLPVDAQPSLGVFDREADSYALKWLLSNEGPKIGDIPLETALLPGREAGSLVRTTHLGNKICDIKRGCFDLCSIANQNEKHFQI